MTDRILRTDGAILSMTDTGTTEPALIFLHYWGGSSRTWADVIARLDDGPRCIAIDQRGWGRSVATDGRYDLEATARDVLSVIGSLALRRYILVGHSMGGKAAQAVAAGRPEGLVGMVLVAPAPPTPMPAPPEQRAAMLASYATEAGVSHALSILAGPHLPERCRDRIIADTLRGAPDAKRAWTEDGMTAAISPDLASVRIPVRVLVGDRDQVEREGALREALRDRLPQTIFTTLAGIGHLAPLEAPEAVAQACRDMLARC